MVSGTAEAIAIDATEYTVTEHFMVSDVDAVYRLPGMSRPRFPSPWPSEYLYAISHFDACTRRHFRHFLTPRARNHASDHCIRSPGHSQRKLAKRQFSTLVSVSMRKCDAS